MNVEPCGRTIDVGGVATHFYEEGDGPALLLLHGSGPGVSAWVNWNGVQSALARRHRVVAPDLLGFGRTTPPAGVTWDVQTWLAHLMGFCDVLGLDRVAVVGNSFGGALALHLAAAQPERISRLVLMGSVGVSFPLTPGLDRVWGFTPSLAGMHELLGLFAYDSTRLTDELAQVRLAAATRPGVQEAYAAMFPAPRQEVLDAIAVDESRVAGIQTPTLLLHGRNDRVIPLAASLHLHYLITRSQLHVFGECGHWVQIEQRDRFLSLVHAFLDEENHTPPTGEP